MPGLLLPVDYRRPPPSRLSGGAGGPVVARRRKTQAPLHRRVSDRQRHWFMGEIARLTGMMRAEAEAAEQTVQPEDLGKSVFKLIQASKVSPAYSHSKYSVYFETLVRHIIRFLKVRKSGDHGYDRWVEQALLWLDRLVPHVNMNSPTAAFSKSGRICIHADRADLPNAEAAQSSRQLRDAFLFTANRYFALDVRTVEQLEREVSRMAAAGRPGARGFNMAVKFVTAKCRHGLSK